MRILIVDDEPTIRNGVKRTIEAAFPSAVVQTADSGEAALLWLPEVDIVFLDVMMPGMGGLELLRLGKKDFENIRWIVISAYSDFSFAQQALRYGAKDYLLKPVGKQKVIELLQEADEAIRVERSLKVEQEQLDRHMHYIREAVFQRWASGLDTGHYDMTPIAKEYAGSRLIMVSLLPEEDTRKSHLLAEEALSAWMRSSGKGFCVSFGQRSLLGVFLASASLSEENILAKLQVALGQTLKGSFRLQVSQQVASFDHIHKQVTLMQAQAEETVEKLGLPEANSNVIVQTALKYIQDNYQNNLTLEKVAAAVYLNPVYFSHLFKQTNGIGYKEYVIQLRIEQAKDLLKHSTCKITDIAERVGYQDMRHFTQVFRKAVSMTPSEYRLQESKTSL
ncbi:response regulator transcription factor [Paenibacillus sinopodophylli]|uniref:response regulator transcription factor n=1 Tax=Paenibacillus sinopodophylli TaxID=1837342 RepID=UPI00110CAEDF|nr:response regulator [Paenibacillus sinopodophylli]